MLNLNKNKVVIIITVITGILLYFGLIKIFGNKITTVVNVKNQIELGYQPRLEDDFYDYTNYKYLNKNNLGNEDYWSLIFTDAEKKIEDERNLIIDDILSKCNDYKSGNYKKICDFYNSYINSESSQMLNELNKYIDLIKNVNSIEEYLNIIFKLNKELGMDVIVNPDVNFKENGSSKHYFTLDSLTYDYNLTSDSSDYSFLYNTIYTNSEYKIYLNYLKKYDMSLLETYGYSYKEANIMIKKLHEMYSNIALFSLRGQDEYIDKGYKLYDLEQLKSELHNIPINDIVNLYDNIYASGEKILVADINQIKEIDNYLTQDNLETLKTYAIVKILTNYSKYINEDYYKIDKQMNDYKNYYFFASVENSSNKEFNKKEIIYDDIYTFFQDTITERFSNKFLTENEKQFYTKLVEDEINMFKLIIEKKDWLTNETKTKAINKLNNIKYTVGVPSELVFSENNYIVSDNYMNNIINLNRELTSQAYKQYLNGNIMYGIDLLISNAYYSPNNNSISVLLGMIYAYKTVFNLDTTNLEDNYYKILGTMGSIIGHELTHSLDSSGSKYDEKGNYVNWWNEVDKDNFKKLNIKVIKYYDKYNEFGDNTLSENIADLGSMNIILKIAEDKKALDTDYKVLFESFANLWCSQKSSYYNRIIIENDVHSFDKVRVNAVLSSTDKFYEIYNIKPTDKMFVNKSDRVSVW